MFSSFFSTTLRMQQIPFLSAPPLLSFSKGLLRGCLPLGRGACPRCQQGHFWAPWAQCGGADTPVGWPAAEGQQEGRSGGGLLQVLRAGSCCSAEIFGDTKTKPCEAFGWEGSSDHPCHIPVGPDPHRSAARARLITPTPAGVFLVKPL